MAQHMHSHGGQRLSASLITSSPNHLHFVCAEYLRICGRAGDLQAAQAAWQDAERLGVQPDVILYTAMIDACAKARLAGGF